jgi:hypothetical protein
MIKFNVIHVRTTFIFSVLDILKGLKTVSQDFHLLNCLVTSNNFNLKYNVTGNCKIKLEEIVKSIYFIGNQFNTFNNKIDSVLN